MSNRATATNRERFYIPRDKWGPGPWQNEPDHIAFVTKNGMPAICHRNGGGAWCGYVAVPPGHPLHSKSYDTQRYERDEDGCNDYDKPLPGVHVDDLRVHGGITYGEACAGEICHVPAPGEPDDVWWLGFDMSHSGDLSPAREAMDSRYRLSLGIYETYRDLEYAKSECEELAEQLAALVSP